MDNTTPDNRSIWERLAAAQLEYKPLVANHTVKTQKFTYKYATLDENIAATRAALAKHGISATQSVEADGDYLYCKTRLCSKDGEVTGAAFIEIPKHGSPQDYGSALTYVRRYSYQMVTGIAVGDEDTDGPPVGKFERDQEGGPAPAPKPEPNRGQAIALNLARMATKAGLITGSGKDKDASKFMTIVKKVAPEVFYPETEQKPGHLVDWQKLTEAHVESIKGKIAQAVFDAGEEPPPADQLY